MVKIIRSKRKSMRLQVLDTCEVIVRVPVHMPETRVKAFVDAHEEWIECALEKARVRRESTIFVTPEEAEVLRSKAKEVLIPRVYELAQQFGFKPCGVTIRHQKTRWGSCSARQTLSLNCQLMLLPEELRDYIIVHELCHLKHLNHGPAFWALVQKCLPNALTLRRELRTYIIQPLDNKHVHEELL